MAKIGYIMIMEQQSILSITQRFGTQEACISYLESIRWPDGPVCTNCGSHHIHNRKDSHRYLCRDCNHSFSVTVGTIMHASKLPLPKWFAAIFLIVNAKKGISSLQLSRDINVNKNTAWYMQKRIRKAMSGSDGLLKGIVEVDESYLGGSMTNMRKSYKKELGIYPGGMEHKKPVLGMMQRKGSVKVMVIDKADAKTIRPLLDRHIDASSEVVTDGFGAYRMLHRTHAKHITLNHSKNIMTAGKYNTSRLDSFWTTIKRAIVGQYHRVSPEHLQGYLDEIAFKFNNKGKDLFNLLICKIIQGRNEIATL
ncbi:IS1595 family transposase [Flavivirga rizhaonensis]|uniref:IS1595 family transposase n=1 Tax=Flavivirga rizhaonensis TaxID=2559571 RepID=A0A4S1DQP3_9FLAO|nr:IS1595 family transposase [Flavivirga rizhaonensis]TGV00167.1 IS1595 family transposase [Flavivirga rizhaonensis]